MRYCTLEDLTLAIPARTLAQLSNDTAPANEPNLNGRYTVDRHFSCRLKKAEK